MMRLLALILGIIIVMLALYGLVKGFREVRAKWCDLCSRRDSEAAEARRSAEVFSALPGRLDELTWLHKDLKQEVSRLKEDDHLRRKRVIALENELTSIRRALRGYV